MTLSDRIKRIFSHSTDAADVILIKNASAPFIDSTFFYVTGIKQGLFEGCTALIYPSGSVHLLVSSLEQPLVPSHIPSSTYTSKKEFTDSLHQFLDDKELIGLNTASLLYDEYQQLHDLFPDHRFVSVSNAIKSARIIKDAEELNRIREACSIADQVMEKIPTFFTSPLTEQELAAEIDHQLKQFGASSPAFETISSFGKNTAKPHYTNGKKEIQPGEFILCDFGATLDHYHSDTTRTFVYGKPTEQQKRIHHTVRSAQQRAIQTIKPGITANTIHQVTSETIDATEFKGYFIHSTGHGLGLEVHDPGIGFSETYDATLQPGMVLTVEPGIYIPGLGGVRIEDDIVVSPDGCIQLTASSKELIEIPCV